MTSVREAVIQILDFFDIYNTIFVGISLVVMALTLYFDAPLAVAVAFFTAVYAFIAFNRMRRSESVWIRSPTVRRDSFKKGESDSHEFGLTNFGPGPALYLRVHATVEPNGPSVTIHESDLPLHLDEGDSLSLLRGDLAELRDEESDLYSRDDATRVELYYTFDSLSGRQTPPGLENPREMSVDELVERATGPRTEKLENLRQNCTGASEVVEEPTL